MPSVWDAHANTNLLISINEIQNPKPPNWKDVAEKMKAKGYVGFTNEACRQHYQKLRKDAKKAASGDETTTTAPAKKAAPRKTQGSTRTKGGSKATSPFDTAADDDDEASQAPPSKKRKLAATLKEEKPEQSDEGSVYGSAGPKFKVEEDGNSNDGREDDFGTEFHYDF